ncbi:hypothetical protein [Shewanella sp.]|uniref:hypothetical protein n=1 Tax=Shewanella sp. TaxID=50422 RepID=UPI003D0A5D0F
MLLNTFFCRQGVDTSLRFLVITCGSLCLIYLFSLLFAGHGILVLFALPLVALNILSAARRLPKALSLQALIMLPGPLLFSVSLVLAEQTWLTWVALILSLLAAGYIVSRPQPKALSAFDSLGYSGPKQHSQTRRPRVEPTLAGSAPLESIAFDAVDEISPSDDHYQSDDKLSRGLDSVRPILNDLLAKLKRHPRAALLGFGCLSLLLGSLFWLGGDNTTEQVISEAETEAAVDQAPRTAIKQVSMPDGFKVQLEGKVLMLSWLGERGEPGIIWSLASAEGDSSCQNLTFNNGASYRPMEVHLLADSSTQARFSPLDVPAIINDIAMRGSLTLCGYEFSLKGSQAALAKEAAFRPYL